MRWKVTVGAVALGVGLAFAGAPTKKTPPPPKEELTKGLRQPEYLNELARQLLRQRMTRHGKDMTRLVQAVLLLEKDVAKDLAQAIASEPRITRPSPGASDELNSALPEQFFVRQDELRERAKALAQAAAQGGSDDALAVRLGELTRTCVGCHSAYLQPSDALDAKPAAP
ncbi:MAG: cytochrome c [Myxococcota bacterium]